MQATEVSFKEVASLIKTAFPGAKSRRVVKIYERETYHIADFWDGGSRNECKLINLQTNQVLSSDSIPTEVRQKAANPYNLPITDVRLSENIAIIEHCIFCGKDLGYRIYVGTGVCKRLLEPLLIPAALPSSSFCERIAALSEGDK